MIGEGLNKITLEYTCIYSLEYTPLMISGTPVERVSSFKYLGVNISEDLTWTAHIQTQGKIGKDCTICDS